MQLSPVLVLVFGVLALGSFALAGDKEAPTTVDDSKKTYPAPSDDGKVTLSDAEWKEKLSREEFRILRTQGTERAFTGDLWDHKGAGTYLCAACGLELFASDTKFKSGTGWPSYYQPIADGAIGETVDRAYGMKRTEVHCNRCGGHLGHVFEDGPQPTGLRYCINSVSLDFVGGGTEHDR